MAAQRTRDSALVGRQGASHRASLVSPLPPVARLWPPLWQRAAIFLRPSSRLSRSLAYAARRRHLVRTASLRSPRRCHARALGGRADAKLAERRTSERRAGNDGDGDGLHFDHPPRHARHSRGAVLLVTTASTTTTTTTSETFPVHTPPAASRTAILQFFSREQRAPSLFTTLPKTNTDTNPPRGPRCSVYACSACEC